MSSLLFLLSGTRKKSGKDAFNVEETPSKIQGKLMAAKSHKVYTVFPRIVSAETILF